MARNACLCVKLSAGKASGSPKGTGRPSQARGSAIRRRRLQQPGRDQPADQGNPDLDRRGAGNVRDSKLRRLSNEAKLLRYAGMDGEAVAGETEVDPLAGLPEVENGERRVADPRFGGKARGYLGLREGGQVADE